MWLTTASKVFLDSSVLIAAAISPSGNARALLLRGLGGEETLVVSPFVLAESERNLALKAPRSLQFFVVLRGFLEPWTVTPTRELVEQCAGVVEAKDAPIVAGALAAGANWIVSYDQRHLLSQTARISAHFGIHVATPDAYLKR